VNPRKQPGSSVSPQRVSAIQALQGGEGSRLGLLTQLELTPETTIAGPGFNEKTIRVRSGEHFYFVFREDLATVEFPTSDVPLTLAAAG
jgi:hypothetical protein